MVPVLEEGKIAVQGPEAEEVVVGGLPVRQAVPLETESLTSTGLVHYRAIRLGVGYAGRPR